VQEEEDDESAPIAVTPTDPAIPGFEPETETPGTL